WVVLLRHMSTLYAHALAGRLGEVTPLPPFHDYVAYEQNYRESERFQADKAYWNSKRAEGTAPLSFFGQIPRKRTTQVERRACVLGAGRTAALRTLLRRAGIASRSESVSLLSLFLLLEGVLLSRLSGQQSVVMGTPFRNRPSRAFRETVGPFMQPLPL